MKDPKQANLNNVVECLQTLALAIDLDEAAEHMSAIVLLRVPGNPTLHIYGFGKGEEYTAQAFAECQIASAQLLDAMRK